MTRQKNDGRGRIGGRQKGTPNKVTLSVREWLAKVIDNNREQVEADISILEPKDRLQIIEKFLQYVLPKLQALDASVNTDELSEAQLDAIISRITKGSGNEGDTFG